jgi:hypothetical protein
VGFEKSRERAERRIRLVIAEWPYGQVPGLRRVVAANAFGIVVVIVFVVPEGASERPAGPQASPDLVDTACLGKADSKVIEPRQAQQQIGTGPRKVCARSRRLDRLRDLLRTAARVGGQELVVTVSKMLAEQRDATDDVLQHVAILDVAGPRDEHVRKIVRMIESRIWREPERGSRLQVLRTSRAARSRTGSGSCAP